MVIERLRKFSLQLDNDTPCHHKQLEAAMARIQKPHHALMMAAFLQAYTNELETEVIHLQEENAKLRRQYHEVNEDPFFSFPSLSCEFPICTKHRFTNFGCFSFCLRFSFIGGNNV